MKNKYLKYKKFGHNVRSKKLKKNGELLRKLED